MEPRIIKLAENCIRIESFLSLEEQISLWEKVLNDKKQFKESQARNNKSKFTKILNIKCTTKKWKNNISNYTNICNNVV